MEYSVLISIISLIFSGISIYMQFFYSKEKKLANKIKVTQFIFCEEFGNKQEGTDGLSYFALKIRNNSNQEVSLYQSSIAFNNDGNIKYCDVVSKSIKIRQGEEQVCLCFIYGKKFVGECVEILGRLPENRIIKKENLLGEISQLNSDNKLIEEAHIASMKYSLRFRTPQEGLEWLKNKTMELYKTTDKDLIKKILKNISINCYFTSDENIKFHKKYAISSGCEDFAKFVRSI
jgi:hypothetical protein